MVIKTYSVTLDHEVVERAKKKIAKNGGKLSPVINQMLKDWCEAEEARLKKEEDKRK